MKVGDKVVVQRPEASLYANETGVVSRIDVEAGKKTYIEIQLDRKTKDTGFTRTTYGTEGKIKWHFRVQP